MGETIEVRFINAKLGAFGIPKFHLRLYSLLVNTDITGYKCFSLHLLSSLMVFITFQISQFQRELYCQTLALPEFCFGEMEREKGVGGSYLEILSLNDHSH
jgi:hypothetical protein